MVRGFCLLALLGLCEAFTPPTKTFATFGNDASKALIRSWTPQATPVDTGVVLIPDVGNMQRYVRARILLEDANVGCIASFDDDSLCVVRPLPPASQLASLPCPPRGPSPPARPMNATDALADLVSLLALGASVDPPLVARRARPVEDLRQHPAVAR